MTETGWPLIPREVLPAPVQAARGVRRRPSVPHDLGRQLSIFGADTTEPSPNDLVGLLAGPGRLGRMGGTARVSVPVDAAWRVHVLVAELVIRGLAASWAPIGETKNPDAAEQEVPEAAGPKSSDAADRQNPEAADPRSLEAGEPEVPEAAGLQKPAVPEGDKPEFAEAEKTGPEVEPGPGGEEHLRERPDYEVTHVRFEVRTAYSRRLNGLARAWPAAAGDLFLSGPRLRLWVAAAGRPRPGGYGLGLDPETADCSVIDAALVRAGLTGTVSDHGRCYVITGRRRLKRLAELVGDPPEAAPEGVWPGAATA